MSRRIALLFLFLSSIFLLRPSGSAQETPAQTVPAKPHVEIVHDEAGPFIIGGKKFTFRTQLERIRHKREYQGKLREELEDAADWVRIEDAAGNTVWEERYAVSVNEYGFEDSTTADARKIIGTAGEGLMVDFEQLPSAPPAGGSLLVFAMKDGELRKCGEPLFIYGQMMDLPSAGPDVSHLFPGDLLKINEWTGNFEVTREYFVDLQACAISLACKARCSYAVAGELQPIEAAAQVRLYAKPETGAASKLVSVHPGSKVVRLQAYEATPGKVEENAHGAQYGPWLKVRVDGVEGWVRDAEDLDKLGMPEAG